MDPRFALRWTRRHADGRLVVQGRRAVLKPANTAACLFVIPVVVMVVFNAVLLAMAVVNSSLGAIFGPGQRYRLRSE